MYGYIYLTTNKITGKQYVGQHTKSEFDTKYKGSGVAITKAFKKYGEDNFECHIIDTATTQDELNDKEYVYVELYQTLTPNGYNLMEGGGCKGRPSNESKQKISETLTGKYTGEKNGMYGKHHTDKTKQKLSEAGKGRKLSDETKQKMSESQKKRCEDPDERRKLSEARKGKTLTEEHKRKIGDANKGRKHTQEELQKMSEASKRTWQDPEKRLKQSETQKGKKLTTEHKQKISEVTTGENNPCYGKKLMNDGITQKYIPKDEVEMYLEQGWKLGKLNK